MASEVSICSNALLLLGQKPISSLLEANDNARLAANLYEGVRDDMLRAHTWNFAVKRRILSPETATPAFGYSYQFVLPSDWLKTLAVGEDDDEIDYRIEGRRILADTSELKLRYIWRNENPATWDARFIQLMTLAMKAAMAYPVTKSQATADSSETKLDAALKAARAADGQDNPPEQLGDLDLYSSRF